MHEDDNNHNSSELCTGSASHAITHSSHVIYNPAWFIVSVSSLSVVPLHLSLLIKLFQIQYNLAWQCVGVSHPQSGRNN